MSDSDSDEEKKDPLSGVKGVMRQMGMSDDIMMPPKEDPEAKKEYGPENLPQMPAHYKQQQEQAMDSRMAEGIKYFANCQRERCQELGAGTYKPPERIYESGEVNEDYFSLLALYHTCLGKGEGKASICVAMSLKDEQAAKSFREGDYKAAEMNYRLALWLLCEDDSEYVHVSMDLAYLDECPGAPHSNKVDRFAELPEDFEPPPSTQPAQETEMSEEDLDKLKAAEKVARERYTSDLPLKEQAANLRQTMRLNLVAVALKQGDFEKAKLTCEKILRGELTQAQQEKVQYRYAQACEGEGSYGRALKAATKLINMKPNIQEFRDLHARVKKKKEQVDQTYKKMSKAQGGKQGQELYSEEDQRRERAIATYQTQSKEWTNDLRIPEYCDAEWLANASKADRNKMLEEMFKEKLEDRVARFENMGLTQEMGEHIESLYRQGYRVDELEKMMEGMRLEANDELRANATPIEMKELEELGSALYRAKDAWEGAENEEEKKEAYPHLYDCSEAYKAKVREIRASSKKRMNDELQALLSKVKEKDKKEEEEKVVAEKAVAQGSPSEPKVEVPDKDPKDLPAATKLAPDKPKEVVKLKPKAAGSEAKRPDASCCAGAKQCRLM